MDSEKRALGAAGFTLMEMLIAVAVLGAICIAVAAISVSGLLSVSDSTQERHADSTAAQWASMAFARDVQGAAMVVDECAAAEGVHLVTLRPSVEGPSIEYRRSTSTPYRLHRLRCGVEGSGRTVIEELAVPPTVECEGTDGTTGPCTPGSTPSAVKLRVGRSDTFAFELDGVRRLTDGNSSDPPLEAPTFMSLGGGTPLLAGGSSQLRVNGNALINRPSAGTVAVRLLGGPANPADPSSYRLSVSGEFMIQAGAVCDGCDTKADRAPGTFQRRALDPLRFLPVPDLSALSLRTNCPVQAGVRLCQPGIYEGEFPPSVGGGGVKDFELQPGTYVLRDGMRVNNGSVVGSGVLLYNESGSVQITGAGLDLSPAESGHHSGVLFFQARSNTASFTVVGNAALASLNGAIYAPNSSAVTLGGGGGSLHVARVIGQNLQTTGGGTVVVGGN